MSTSGPIQTIQIPQWTHADLPPGEQAAIIAAKTHYQYGNLYAGEARREALAAGKSEAEAEAAAKNAYAACQVPIGGTPAHPLWITMYTGDTYEVVANADGRWGAKLIVSSGPEGLPVRWADGKEMLTPKVGTVFLARHGAEHESMPEVSTHNIRVECGVVKIEGRVDGHDQELKELRTRVKRLEAELAEVRGQVKGLRAGQNWKNEATQEAEEKVRMLEL